MDPDERQAIADAWAARDPLLRKVTKPGVLGRRWARDEGGPITTRDKMLAMRAAARIRAQAGK